MKKVRQHAADDMLKKAREASQEKDQARRVEDSIILATIGAPDVPHNSGLPERPTRRPANPKDSKGATGSNTDPAAVDELGIPPDTSSESMTSETHAAIVRERFAYVSLLQSQLDLQSCSISRDAHLVFKPVTEYSDTPGSLEELGGQNASFVAHREWIDQTLEQITGLPLTGQKDADMRYVVLLEAFKAERQRLQDVLHRAWNRQMWAQFVASSASSEDEPIIIPAANMHVNRLSIQPFLMAGLVMVTVLHTFAGVSFPAAQYVLATVKVLLLGAFTLEMFDLPGSPTPLLSPAQQAALRGVPLDLRTVLDLLQVNPNIVSYACCPRCFATYLPDPADADHPYPRTCTRRAFPDAPQCNRKLVRSENVKGKKKGDPAQTITRPEKVYSYRRMKSWLAEFLGRAEIESAVLEAWERQPDPAICLDIMDAPAIRTFVGPDGTTLFSVQTNGAIHLVFSLFIDWFNPYGNKKAGKSHSIGAIYMVCLNLPPHMRFRPENVYLAGIIPGPKEPSVDQLNELLRPLVDELLELWNPGIYLAQTASRAAGRLIRAAMIPLVCDLPALRKTAGFASYSSTNFCSFCPLPLADINNVERSTWPQQRSWTEHLSRAEEWKSAPSEKAQANLVKAHGIRWSELLRLPYWDPTRYAVLDVMHNLFLGEILHHCKSVWGTAVAEENQPSTTRLAVHSPEEQQGYLDKVFNAVCARAEKRLAGIRRDYLSAVARFNNVVGETSSNLTRQQLAAALLAWDRENPTESLHLPPVLNEPAARFRLPKDDLPAEKSKYDIFDAAILHELRKDIASTVLPSWMEKAPRNFGTAAHGKLKADQWRTLGTVNLVITLVRLWGSSSASDEEREVLDNFIHLACAVDLASRRSMHAERAAAYDRHMEAYLKGLRRLYKHQIVPNHHLSLHLRPLLEAFGPVHGWWAFPFERYNGILQRMNTNSKPSDLPTIFMRSWYIGANIRWLIRTTNWPKFSEYDDMLKAFDTAFHDRVRGTRVTDILEASRSSSSNFPYDGKREVHLARRVYEELLAIIGSRMVARFQSVYDIASSSLAHLPPVGQPVTVVERDGIRFAVRSHNSYVRFRSRTGAVLAGQIHEIFYHQPDEGSGLIIEPFLVIKAYRQLSPEHTASDPYRQFPDLNTHLVYDEFDDDTHVVSLGDIISHFAAYRYTPDGIDRECVIVRSLDRS
ncbi:hypothetical protein BN946_scf184517.g5 [Trametes cinnabarina]|uniref:DUF4218 domain-containing protein n=1 Tax=Pycnoporus cinnabarinus TaxID=5643 RepID=A0A060SLF7_PYCCI|nr:hypothetical protein BN946_scf184517.g5 [Trametes cinnabarina]